MKAQPVLYAKSGDLQIAYTVAGSGPVDFVYCPGFVSHLQLQWDSEYYGRAYAALASFCRLIVFDKRGTGMSDRPAGIPTLEERIDDIRAVMDAAQSDRAHIFGLSEGGTMACLFAATYPERTRSLLLYGTRPRWTRTPDYPWGPTLEEEERTTQRRINEGWRTDFTSEVTRHWMGAGLRDDPVFQEWWTRFLQSAATPGARPQLNRMNTTIDVPDILSTIRVPTLIIGKTHDPVMPPDCAKDLAARIPRCAAGGDRGRGASDGRPRRRGDHRNDESVGDRGGRAGRQRPFPRDRPIRRHRPIDRAGHRDRRRGVARPAGEVLRTPAPPARAVRRRRAPHRRRRPARALRRPAARDPLRRRDRARRQGAGPRGPRGRAHRGGRAGRHGDPRDRGPRRRARGRA